MTELLLAHKADVEAKNKYGLTPFSQALRFGCLLTEKLDVLKTLVAAGARVPLQDELFLLTREACEWGHDNKWPTFNFWDGVGTWMP